MKSRLTREGNHLCHSQGGVAQNCGDVNGDKDCHGLTIFERKGLAYEVDGPGERNDNKTYRLVVLLGPRRPFVTDEQF